MSPRWARKAFPQGSTLRRRAAELSSRVHWLLMLLWPPWPRPLRRHLRPPGRRWPPAPSIYTSTTATSICFASNLTRFRADVAVPGAGGPMTAAELRRESGAALVINGGFFDTDGRSLGLRIASGRKLIKLRARRRLGRARHPRRPRRHRPFARLRRRGGRPAARDRRHPGRPAASWSTASRRRSSRRPRAAPRSPSIRPGRFLTIVVARARMEAGALGAPARATRLSTAR